MIHLFKRDQATHLERYRVWFDGGVECEVRRASDGHWWWSAKGMIYEESGIVPTKRRAAFEALDRVKKIQKMKFKQP